MFLSHRPVRLLTALAIALACVVSAPAQAVSYDIVYVKQPRFGDETNTTWPEVFHPARMDPGADLMLLHPDGTEELLFAGGVGSVTDPFLSFDAQWIYFSYFYDLSPGKLNGQRNNLPHDGADIFRIHLVTRVVEQLTFGEFTPNTGAGNWDETNPLNPPSEFNRLGYGILNLGPCPLPGGKIAFTSNRNGFDPPKGFTNPTLQLYVMDEDGSNVTPIGPLTISSALHPTVLRDGRIGFSTHEAQALRDRRLWGIWSIYPDGRKWGPLVSAFRSPQAFHFMTQLSNEDIVVVDYYNLNNNGFGSLLRFPVRPPAGTPAFHSAFPSENPAINQTVGQGFLYPFRIPFTPWGMFSITPFTHGNDEAAPEGDSAVRVGKFTHPSAAPNSDLLVAWTPGPANDLNRPTPLPRYDSGLYLMAGANEIWSPANLILIKNDPNYNEAWPRAVVPYSAVHGVAEPAQIPWLPNDGSESIELPAGTPFGLVGTSSFYKRESFPGHVTSWANSFDGLDAFNTTENGQSSNWGWQGSDVGKYDNSEIWAVRILAMEPNTHRSYGPNLGRHFDNHANERLRILGEIPLRKFAGGVEILDPEGNPDTSFLAKIPADTPFTFQTLDRDGLALNMAQTWHQLRPGEIRNDCGGCHAHSQTPLDFALTEAASPAYPIHDLSATTPLLTKDGSGQPALAVSAESLVNVEFYRDIRPILERSCTSCHTQSNPTPPGNLVLDDQLLYSGLPGDYARLADDTGAQWGYPPLVKVGGNPVWRQTNASRYVRKFQSRRSLLMWKIFGRRLDGWSNADHPTESTPGDATTLPEGAAINDADLDFTGTIMPPPGSPAPPLSEDEKIMFTRWIDLGCPINSGEENGNGAFGWLLDDLKPTLTVSLPRPGLNAGPVSMIRVGVADAYTGIDGSSLSITADFVVEGRAAGSELSDLATELSTGVHVIALSQTLPPLTKANIFAEVADNQGNITRVKQTFSTVDTPPAPSMSTSQTDSPDPVQASNSLTYVLTVNNTSPSIDLQNVAVTDPLPADLTLVSATPSQGSCSGTSTINCSLGTIAPGLAATVTIVADVDPAATGSFSNTATVSADGVASQNPTASTTVSVPLPPSMSTSQTDSPDPVQSGGSLTYVVAVNNTSPSIDLQNVAVTDPLPADLTLVSATASQGSCSGTSTINCPLGTIAPGLAATVTIVANVDPSATGSFSNTATVSADGVSSQNPTASTTVSVPLPPSMSTSQTDSPDPVQPGGSLTYSIAVTNTSPSVDLENILMNDPLPADVALVSATPSQGSCSGTSTVSCSFGNLDPGLLATVAVIVNVDPAATGPLTNQATISADGVSSQTASATTAVVEPPPPTMEVTLSDAPDPVKAGHPLVYILQVTNTSEANLENIVISDPLPRGVTFDSSAPTQGSCNGTGTIECTLGRLTPGRSAAVTITVTVKRKTKRELTNAVRVSAAGVSTETISATTKVEKARKGGKGAN